MFHIKSRIKKDNAFYQAKFEYYRTMNTWIVIAISISSLFYVISDWYLFGEMDMCTLPARLFILIPFVVFLHVNKYVKDYRIIVPFSYLLGHMTMWDTIWACTFLPDLSYASDGFIIICAVFIVLGIAGPVWLSILLHGLLFVDILIANTFLHYPDFKMMLILGIPFFCGISLFIWALEKTFVDQYIIKNKLEQSVVKDQLTGAYNRKIIDSLVNKDMSFMDFYGDNLSIMLLDIDFFKKVNDTYGHDKGDIVLKEVVNVIKSNLRSPDYLIRWGGEEFIVLMSASYDITRNRAEQIRAAIENNKSEICPVTVSIGVTKYDGGNYNDSIKRVDEALYRAKANGRNRVESA